MTAHTVTTASGEVGTTAFTLVAATVDTVTFTATDVPFIEVISLATNTADTWYTTDGTAPTVGGANAYYLPAGSVDRREPSMAPTGSNTVVKLISAGTPTLRVQKGL